MRKLILFLAAVSLVLFAEKALCYETTFSIEPEAFNSFRYEEIASSTAAPLSIRTGRFLSVDPHLDIEKSKMLPQRWNRYAYVMNNPLRYTDPNGRDEREGWKAGVVVNNSSQPVTIAGDVNGRVQVAQLGPGQTSTALMQDADAIIPNNQTMRFGPAGVESISEAPDIKEGAIKVGFGKVEVKDTSNKTLRLSPSIGYMLSVFAFRAGVVTPATAQQNGWVAPQQQQTQQTQTQQQQTPPPQQQQQPQPQPTRKKTPEEERVQ